MEKFKKFTSDLTIYSFFWMLIANLMALGGFLLLNAVLHLDMVVAACLSVVLAFGLSLFAARLSVLAATQPLRAVWQAVMHVSPHGHNIPAPDLAHMTHGQLLASELNDEIYSLATLAPAGEAQQPLSVINTVPTATPSMPEQGTLLELLPVPVLALNKAGEVVLANKQLAAYIGSALEDVLHKPFADTMRLSFPGGETFEQWLSKVSNSAVTATATWDRVKLTKNDGQGAQQFDLVAYYNKDNSLGYETLLAIFDHTAKYQTEDTGTSYVALAVHELRTPLTVLRGYIEVFEDELGSKLTPELQDFMHKMSASAQTLTAFVSNILNVARVDENQLNLSLHEANWNELLKEIASSLELRAKVRGKHLELDIKPGLPTVAVDKVSIYEVVSNLVENAIKYSTENPKIILHAATGEDGSVETVVQDFGLGIPESAMKYLFTKFYRSHRSSGKVGGSGLGLYLVKAIVTAHGGRVWVSSHEGEGSSFGFSLQPYAAVKNEANDGAEIVREAHGWIKNHSIYRS